MKKLYIRKPIYQRWFCMHHWVHEWTTIEMYTKSDMLPGSRDWRTDSSCWQCAKCGQLGIFSFNFIPINYIGQL